jgi:hypothetical protein
MEPKRKSTRRWKWCWISFLLLIAAGTSFAQESIQVSAPPIEILKFKWEKQVRLPRNFDPSILPANGVLADPVPRSAATAPPTLVPASGGGISDQTRAATSALSEAAGSSTAFPAIPGRLPIFYIYSMKIKNTGPKTIEGIAWDYVFIDPNGGAELGRHQFLSYLKAPQTKVVTLKGQMRSPPIRIARASSAAGQKHTSLIERAAIQCVLFEDETVWSNPAQRKDVCEFLKSSETLIKQKPRANQH